MCSLVSLLFQKKKIKMTNFKLKTPNFYFIFILLLILILRQILSHILCIHKVFLQYVFAGESFISKKKIKMTNFKLKTPNFYFILYKCSTQFSVKIFVALWAYVFLLVILFSLKKVERK